MQVLILDDHPLLSTALRDVVKALVPQATVQVAATVEQAESVLAQDIPLDLALLDLHLPDIPGLRVLAEWRQRHPEMPVVVVSASQNPEDAHAALALGARGYIPKTTGNAVLMHALQIVLAGAEYVPSFALPHRSRVSAEPPPSPAVHRVREHAALSYAPTLPNGWMPGAPQAAPPAAELAPTPVPQPPLDGGMPRLTPRQIEVLRQLMQGRSNKLIARHLCLSVETVKDHVASLLRALGVRTRTQAVLLVNQWDASGAGLKRLGPAAERPGLA